MANYNRQANFERASSVAHQHSIIHSSRSQYASYGGRRRLSRMSSTPRATQYITHCRAYRYVRSLDCAYVGYAISGFRECANSQIARNIYSLVPRLSGTQNKHAWRAWYIFSRDQNRARVFRTERQCFAHYSTSFAFNARCV